MTLRTLALVVLALGACTRPATRAPDSLEMYADRGPLRVRGARASAPGPAIYRAISADAPRLAGRGEPDTVEVVNLRGKGLRVVMTYPRAPRRVVIEPKSASKQGGRRAVASSRSRRQRSAARTTPAAVRPVEAAPTVATEKVAATPPPAEPQPAPAQMTLSARQALECAIDAERDECRSVCAGHPDYEWCR